MKGLRRAPEPDPDARRRALARLAVGAPGNERHDPTDEGLEERDEQVRGGWIPERLREARWTLAPRHVVVLAVVLSIGLGWAAWSVFRARPEVVPDTRPSTITSGSPVVQPGASPTPATTPGVVIVHVAGKVRRPGLVRAPAGSRVADVLTLAGGALPGVDLTTLNLARQITDGEQIVVGQPAPPGSPGPGPAASTPVDGSAGGPVDLNTATLTQLEALPGVGPVLAQRIVDWRTENGRFSTIDQLQEVPGVGPKKFDSLKAHVRV